MTDGRESGPANSFWQRGLSRRNFVIAAGVSGLALTGACSRQPSTAPATAPTSAGHGATSSVPMDLIEKFEAKRPSTGRTVTMNLTAQASSIDLGGPVAKTLSYGTAIPGPLVRANVGDLLEVNVSNNLDRPTSVHWHGVALRNDMDGAAPATPDIAAGQQFTYRFKVPHSGTYWAHPHTGLDADRGLYVPVVFDDPAEPANYDAEWIVMLDDWTDGVGASPEEIFAKLKAGNMSGMPGHDMGGMDMGGMDMGGMGLGGMGMGGGSGSLLGADAGDVTYPYFLVNGRIPAAPTSFSAKPGQRVRLRLINAGSDTAFRVALAGHTMTITHSDGFPVKPVEADAVLIGMGERYDAIVTVKDGVFPLVAAAEGKEGQARAILKTGAGATPDANTRPAEHDKRIVTVHQLTADPSVDLGDLSGPVALQATLTGGMEKYDWGINGKQYPNFEPLQIREGENAIITFTNHTMMWHPMHLHGHTFQVLNADGTRGPRKDTVAVLPMRTVKVALVADNPGMWMMHCHNTYHMDGGMMSSMDYIYS